MTDDFVTPGGGAEVTPDMLSGYLDGELDATERALVEQRLADSAEWRAELDEVREARSAVRGLPDREAPPGFWDAVFAHVAADEVADGAVDDPANDESTLAPAIPLAPRRTRRLAWIASAAAAVIALVVAVVVVPRQTEVRPNVTAVVAQHGAQSSSAGDPISTLAPVGPFAGFRR